MLQAAWHKVDGRRERIRAAMLETLAGEPGAADGMEQRTLGYLDSLEAAARSLAALSPGVLVLAHA
jgi:hypothetical protein